MTCVSLGFGVCFCHDLSFESQEDMTSESFDLAPSILLCIREICIWYHCLESRGIICIVLCLSLPCNSLIKAERQGAGCYFGYFFDDVAP